MDLLHPHTCFPQCARQVGQVVGLLDQPRESVRGPPGGGGEAVGVRRDDPLDLERRLRGQTLVVELCDGPTQHSAGILR